MKLGISSRLEHSTPQQWAAKHKALGLECVNFPIDFTAGQDVYMAYKQAADRAGLAIAEVGVWRNTLASDQDPDMPMIIEHLTTDSEYCDSVKYVRRRLTLQNED